MVEYGTDLSQCRIHLIKIKNSQLKLTNMGWTKWQSFPFQSKTIALLWMSP